MAYCGPRGIPLSKFLAWADHDQDAALAWQAHEARRCPHCGTHPDDWNPDKGGRRDAFHGQVVICPGCQQIESSREREPDAGNLHGARIILRSRQE